VFASIFLLGTRAANKLPTMNDVCLDIYGVVCLITDQTRSENSQAATQKLSRDFSFFLTAKPRSVAAVCVDISNDFPSGSKSWREIDWKAGPKVRFQVEQTQRTAVFIDHANVAAYIENFINSSVGEILEHKGWFRIHAAGTVENGTLCLWHAPRGSGKSVRTLRALKETHAPLAGDEMIFFHDGIAYPFPIPIGSIEDSRGAVDSRNFVGSAKFLHAVPLERVVKPTRDFVLMAVVKSRFQPFALAYWFASVILGLGLPQMRVYLVRSDTVCWLAIQAFRRAKFAYQLWQLGKVKFITVSELRS
jgi:hypothetical protein